MSGARKAAAAAPVAARPDAASVDEDASVGGSDERGADEREADERDGDAGSAVASSAPEERSIGDGYGGFVEQTRVGTSARITPDVPNSYRPSVIPRRHGPIEKSWKVRGWRMEDGEWRMENGG
jgi:hypothetical protein